MCGILAIFGSSMPPEEMRRLALLASAKLRHRGPDWSGVYQHGNNILCHERLAIVGLDNGAQPLFNEKQTLALSVNGEIYNYPALHAQLSTKHKFLTHSDCEPILYLYEEHGDDCVKYLRGDFAFVVYDVATGHYLAARDPIGVFPLYMGHQDDGSVWFSSECKAIKSHCPRFEAFPPGSYYSSKTKTIQRYYTPGWWDESIPKAPASPSPSTEESLTKLREAFEASVVRRMMCDVPYGVLLSGGLDSSLVASIVSRHAEKRTEDQERTKAWWPRLHSFCIGIQGAPDLIAAKKVADFLGTVHHEFYFTVQEGIDALRDVIYHLETYDVTTIRASTPMYFLARRIKAMGVKMVLSGEGSDEIFGGYLYFHLAPNADEFHKECCRRVKSLYKFDCLRANKSTSAWGVEVRVPFLDQDFLDVAMAVNPIEKVCTKENIIEKWVLRKAFDTPDRPYLPDSILWRQKEQFSDGVGYSWIGGLKEHAEKQVSDEVLAKAASVFPYDTPDTKEAYYYRTLFAEIFPEEATARTVAHWTPTWGASKDPSGRSQGGGIHVAATESTKH